MNKFWKDLWTTALRSDEYKQGRGQLKREKDGETCFCCLGVLCDLVIKHPEGKSLNGGWLSDGLVKFGEDDFGGFLPAPVKVLTGAPDAAPGKKPFYMLNDLDKLTFAQIADIIEEKL
jgi:hypothetical protein